MLRLAVLTLTLTVAAPALASRPQQPLYPTDTCVAAKLDAAAAYCRKSILVGGEAGAALDAAREQLGAAWSSADAASDAAGVSCTDTTASADEMIASLDASAAEIAAALGDDGGQGRSCSAQRQVVAAQACQMLLAQEARHLRNRSDDRTREQHTAAQAHIAAKLAKRVTDTPNCPDAPNAEETIALGAGVADVARMSLLVSPNVSTDWTRVDPGAEVSYLGKTLDPICSRGTPWHFYVKRGTVNKTLMYYQGGGACWSHTTCTFPTHKVSVGAGDNPANASQGFADLNDPANPFRDWNIVFVPYCTGDVHWGDEIVEHTQGRLRVTIYHKGYVNAQVAEKWAREHFVNPEQVFVTGSSAGAYGAIVNSLPLQESVWPSSDFAVLGDAGNGVITEDFLQNDLAKWGIEKNLPDWIPGLDVPITELDAARLWSIPALFYPYNRFANYSTAYDGGQGGQVGFYNVMLNLTNPFAWLVWHPPSCEWNAIMREYSQASAAAAPNYRYYIGSGSRHTMWGNDKVYTDTTGNVPTIVDWVTAMVEETPDWMNVETDDPGLLLPGDPRPNPPDFPYTEDDRIVCD